MRLEILIINTISNHIILSYAIDNPLLSNNCYNLYTKFCVVCDPGQTSLCVSLYGCLSVRANGLVALLLCLARDKQPSHYSTLFHVTLPKTVENRMKDTLGQLYLFFVRRLSSSNVFEL